MPRQLPPNDPRAAIADEILSDAMGNPHLVRCPQLVISADRNGPVRILLTIDSHEVRANGEPMSSHQARESYNYGIGDLPEHLLPAALAITQWMADEAKAKGPSILPKAAPQPEPIEDEDAKK